ncbi:HAD family hydrolase [Hydrogenophaga sp.]|uniref:histidinol-phosphatase n=1 Tax=Hydrogenophaga sp. TaxID=1904254 RepID=UPI00286E4BC2|nr:HAD family hydrolase [Hydrogenophaga sp.]
MRLALFDLDHTLIPIDSDYAWGQFTVQLGWRDAESHTRANDAFYEQYKAGTLDIHEYIRFTVQALREHGVAQSDAAHRRFMDDIIRPAIQPQALELVRRHQAAGDQVVIVTATNEFVTRPIATAFGVPELIAIDLERDAQGNPTGAIRGTPSFREGKVARVEQWLAERGLDWSRVAHSTFYSDSINDLPLLDKVHEPVATNPDARLQAIATERGWRILNLFA